MRCRLCRLRIRRTSAHLLAEPSFHRSGQGRWLANLSNAFGERDGRRNGEEGIGLQLFQVPCRLEAEIDQHGSRVPLRFPCPCTPLGVLARLQGAVGHDHADDAAVFQIQVNAAGKKETGNVLVPWRSVHPARCRSSPCSGAPAQFAAC